MDRGPATGHAMPQHHHADYRAGDVQHHLHDICPDDGRHASFEGVDERQHADDRDRHHVARPDGNANDDRHREDAHAFRCCAKK